jgi:putative endonuclease
MTVNQRVSGSSPEGGAKPQRNLGLSLFHSLWLHLGMPFYIYILYSENANKFYIGYSHNPWKRLNEHNTVEHLTYTSKFRPWQLKAVFIAGENESEAIKMERFIKKQKSRVLLENLINQQFQPSSPN